MSLGYETMSSSTSPGNSSTSMGALNQLHPPGSQSGLTHSTGLSLSSCIDPASLIDERIKVGVIQYQMGVMLTL